MEDCKEYHKSCQLKDASEVLDDMVELDLYIG